MIICCLVLFPVNCIDDLIEFTWSRSVLTSFWLGQRINVPSTYLSHFDGFSNNAISNAISSKYSMYTLANTRDNGDSITSLSSCWYMTDPILKLVVSSPRVNISNRLSIGILGSAANLSRTTASVSQWTGLLLLDSPSGWNEWGHYWFFPRSGQFLTYNEYLPVSGTIIFTRKRLNGWHAEPVSAWVKMEYHPYES